MLIIDLCLPLLYDCIHLITKWFLSFQFRYQLESDRANLISKPYLWCIFLKGMKSVTDNNMLLLLLVFLWKIVGVWKCVYKDYSIYSIQVLKMLSVIHNTNLYNFIITEGEKQQHKTRHNQHLWNGCFWSLICDKKMFSLNAPN